LKVFKSHRIKIYPTKPQEEYFWECIKYSEYIYQKAVDEWYKQLNEIDDINNPRKYININEIIKYVYNTQTSYDEQFSSDIRDSACKRLKQASDRYFSKLSNKPRKKKKSGDRTSFTLPYNKSKNLNYFKKSKKNLNDNLKHKNEYNYYFAIPFGKYYIQKYGLNNIREFRWIKMSEEIRFPYDNHQVKSATILYRAGRWFADFQIEVDETILDDPDRIDKVGIDLGIKRFFTAHDSNNNNFFINIPKKTKNKIIELENNIKHYQKVLIRKVKNSKSYQRFKLKFDIAYFIIDNIKNNFLHKLSTWTVNFYKTINLESLNIKQMVKRGKRTNKSLRRSIYKTKLGYFINLIKNKSIKFSNIINQINQYFPSSQICANCGSKKKLKLSDRIYNCPVCNEISDRDLNAAINIFNYI
jgi:putative transposase